jgi:asparagine synthase (glutamine-hydrolysing)
VRRHWDPAAIAETAMSDADATERFAALFTTAVTSRVEPGATWAQLSGGVDSSSVVATAVSSLGPDALAGTITGVDTLGDGDERRYSDQLLSRYAVRNEQVRDYWAWQDDGSPAPLTDEPHPLYPFYARDRRAHATVRGNGGRVLLSGFGADHYLAPPLDYITDLAARGHIGSALTETAGWSVALRQSFWALGRRHLVRPFLPAALRATGRAFRPPAWVRGDFAKGHCLERRVPYSDAYLGRPGGRVKQQTLRNLTALQAWADRWPWGQDVELRYPFLHRPLVEAVLAMPVDKRIRPGEQKWVLRQAMKQTLPADIGTRKSKGGIDTRILWSLQHEAPLVDQLLRAPALAELGIVDAGALRRAVDTARQGIVRNNVYLMSALALETWLTVRAGRPLAARQAAQSAA